MEEKTLTLGDLHNLLAFIDTSCTRGAVRGDELMAIGHVREKIIDVIQSVEKRIEAEQKKETKVEPVEKDGD